MITAQNRKYFTRKFLFALPASLAFGSVVSQQVTAQVGEVNSNADIIEEIVVTATKRTENLRDIPASIDYVNGVTLEDQGKLSLAEILPGTPGVAVNDAAPGYMRISIRGVGVDNSPTASLPSAVGVLIGDSSFTDPYVASITPDLSAFDLRSVEVLKGPQGTVFGGAAFSGAIRYVLEEPQFDSVEGKAFTQFSEVEHGDNALTSGVAINLPIYEDKLAARFGYVKHEYPGVFDNRRSGEENVNDGSGEQYRGIISWLPTDQLSFKLTYLEQDYTVDDGLFVSDNPRERSADEYLLPQPADQEFSLTSLEASYEFDNFSVLWLTSDISKDRFAFSDVSATFGTPPPGTPLDFAIFSFTNHDSDATSHELRFQSTGDWGVDWVAGLYTFDYDMYFDIYINTVGQEITLGGLQSINDLLAGRVSGDARPASFLYAFNNATANEDAVFFDLSKTIQDRLHLSAGARYYETVVKGGYNGVGLLALQSNGGLPVDIYEEVKEDGVSPKLSIKYDFHDDLSVYAQAARGFRFGGIQTIPASEAEGVPATFKSDKIWNFELGVRSSWLDNTLQVDAAIFKIDYEDPQIQQQTTGSQLNFRDNVGSAESTGFEVGVDWLTPVEGLRLTLNGGTVDAHTTEAFRDSSGNIIPSGTQMPGAAKSQYSAAASYFNDAFGISYNAYLNYNYIGKNYGDLAQTEAVNDFGTLNAGIAFSLENFRLRPQFSINVTNISDETNLIGGTSRVLATTEVQRIFTMNAPRTISARLSLEL